jgi:hypothetical protein
VRTRIASLKPRFVLQQAHHVIDHGRIAGKLHDDPLFFGKRNALA